MAVPSEARRRSTPRIGKWLLPGAAGVVLVAGVIAVLVAFDVGGIRGSAEPGPAQRAGANVLPDKIPQAPLEPEARRVAGRFILTAVARTNLAESYALVAPSLRQGLTLEQWKTGNIPVVPYPTTDLKPVRMSVSRSTKTEAILRVFLDPKSGSDVGAQIFILQLKKFGNQWLVTSWVPYNAIAIPLGTND